MTVTELSLGVARSGQIAFGVLTLGLSSGAVANYNAQKGGRDTNNFAVFQSLLSLLSVALLVTSQFFFISRFEGYADYLSCALIVEALNWIFLFASWIAIAQFRNSGHCVGNSLYDKICAIDGALLAFQIMLWLAWTASLVLVAKLKYGERQDFKTNREIELRIKNAVEAGSRLEEGVSKSSNGPVALPKVEGDP
ncbi:hypothetical protein PYCC9005_000582 [Savitreella phatthalungensis]